MWGKENFFKKKLFLPPHPFKKLQKRSTSNLFVLLFFTLYHAKSLYNALLVRENK